MKYLKIRNWDKWQSYRKDRGQPPWIKLHRCVMRDADWVSLGCQQRGELVSLWLLAADRNGEIPADPEILKKLCFMEEAPDIKLFIKLGFIIDDANVTTTWQPDDANMTHQNRIETEKNRIETESADAVMWSLPSSVDKQAWAEFEQHRKEIRKPLTDLSRSKAANVLTGYSADKQRKIVDLTVQNRWTGLFHLKEQGPPTSGRKLSSDGARPGESWEEYERRVKRERDSQGNGSKGVFSGSYGD